MATQRGSSEHSARVDDEVEREVRSLTRGAPIESRAAEFRVMEGGGDDDPAVVPRVTELEGPDGSPALAPSEVHARSELARHLRGSIFPAEPSSILACAVEEHAPPGLIEALRDLPAGEYRNVEGVWEALGGRRDERSPEGDVEDPVGAAAPRAVIPEPPDPGPGPEPAPPSPPPVPEPPVPSPPVPGPDPAPDPAPDPFPHPDPLPRPDPRPEPPDPFASADESEPAPGQVHRFDFRFAGPFRLAALPFLIDRTHARVTVDTGPAARIEARYGPWCLVTPLANVAGATATGPYALVKTLGPPHVSLVDRGLTFASNRDRGVCVRFVEPVPGIDALGLVRHPALTVTVDDVDGLLAVLRAYAAPTDP